MNVAVLGAGITGLTAAWKISAAGHSVRVFESSPRVGGAIDSSHVDGWLVEAGPNSFQEASPEITALLSDLGVSADIVPSEPKAKNRYIAAGRALVAMPSSPGGLLSSPLFSFGTKLRISGESAQLPRKRLEDVSVAAFVRDHFGAEVLDKVAQPFVGGVYAGDTERLSARHALPKIWEAEKTTGSLIRAGISEGERRRALGLPSAVPIITFRKGLQALPDAIAARLPKDAFSLNAGVRSICPGREARWKVTWDGPASARSEEFDSVVLAVPAWSLAKLEIGAGGARPLSGLSEMEYPPVASVFLGFRRDRVRHPLDGFGALVPVAEKRSILGVLFTSSLFAGRAPPGHVALTAFAGGALQPRIAELPAAELVERVCADLRDLVGAAGPPAFVRHRLWPRAIPQYNLGHERHMDAMASCERAFPGLFIGGNARDGISLPDCMLSGASLAKRVS